MGVNLCGVSPLYVNAVNMLDILTKILAEGKGGTARLRLRRVDELTSSRSTERDCLKEARVQCYEPTDFASYGQDWRIKVLCLSRNCG